MPKAVLRSVCAREPIRKLDAKRLGLVVENFTPTHKATDFGLVLDRSVWVEIPTAGRWMIAFRLVNQQGQPVIGEVRVFPDEPGKRPAGRWSGEYGVTARVPPGGVTARVLRTIRIETFKTLLRTIVRKWGKALGDYDLGFTAAPSPVTRGRKGRPDIVLARMAAVYAASYLAGRPTIPAVARRFRLSPSKARDAVYRARVRGFLSPATKQGKGGGLLTPLAQEILMNQRARRTQKRTRTRKKKGG